MVYFKPQVVRERRHVFFAKVIARNYSVSFSIYRFIYKDETNKQVKESEICFVPDVTYYSP
jgi:hypothetical protein